MGLHSPRVGLHESTPPHGAQHHGRGTPSRGYGAQRKPSGESYRKPKSEEDQGEDDHEDRTLVEVEQEIFIPDPETLMSVVLMQQPDVKPAKSAVQMAAFSNLVPCRVLEQSLAESAADGKARAAKLEELTQAMQDRADQVRLSRYHGAISRRQSTEGEIADQVNSSELPPSDGVKLPPIQGSSRSSIRNSLAALTGSKDPQQSGEGTEETAVKALEAGRSSPALSLEDQSGDHEGGGGEEEEEKRGEQQLVVKGTDDREAMSALSLDEASQGGGSGPRAGSPTSEEQSQSQSDEQGSILSNASSSTNNASKRKRENFERPHSQERPRSVRP